VNGRWSIILVAAVATLLVTASVAAVDLGRPTERTKSCATAECHAKETSYKVLHGPTAIGACDTCHTYADEKKHTFVLKAQGKDLCDFCHTGNITGKVIHKPVAEGNCLGCHNPHGGADRSVLRKDTMAALCADCHKDVTQQRKHVHGPVAAGSCAACHNAHRADHPKLLVAEGRDLCVGCHDQMDKDLKQAKFIHKPVAAEGGDCLKCHEVHASNEIMQLKQAPLALCTSCHEDVKKKVETAAHKHSAVVTGQACLSCHTPHGSQLARLMKDVPSKMCLSCHDKKIEPGKDGKAGPDHVIAAVAELGKPGLNKHGPIRDGNCAGCHEVHGGPEAKLLAKPYPETFYTGFAVEKYDLCFSCHDKQLVLLAETKGLTNFRNGEQNLHYLHVNRDTKGRTCRACHETHASAQAFHIRESVPFGKWDLPINFKPTETGGSCAPGCHKAMGYDREKTVVNPAATQPTNGVPRGTTAGVSGTEVRS